MRRIILLLALVALLTGCTPTDSGSEQRLEGCTVEQVFTCTIDHAPDGRSFTLIIHNTATIPVVDVSATITNGACTLRNDTMALERINAGEDGELTYECMGLVPPALRGGLDITYTLASGYAGEPSRVTQGDFIAYKH